MLLLLLAGCPGSDKDSGLTPTFELQDENNYTYEGTLDVPVYPTVSRTDVEVCWGGLTKDLLCHDLEPSTEIIDAILVRMNIDEATTEEHLVEDTVYTSDFTGYVDFRPETGDVCANLTDFTLDGSPFSTEDEYVEDLLYMITLSDSFSLGTGTRMIAFLAPSTTSDVASVEVQDVGCDMLEYTADLAGATPVTLGSEPWIAGWTQLTRDGMGNPLKQEKIDSLMIGYYEGETPESLQTQLLDLELIADELYELDLEGASAADLTDATGANGNFSGLTGDGTWLLALRCNSCYNPAPKFLGVLQ